VQCGDKNLISGQDCPFPSEWLIDGTAFGGPLERLLKDVPIRPATNAKLTKHARA
jgi:hypothetical protein